MTAKSTKTEPRSAFFAGSFNPFTTGHADIVRRALAVFDTVTIGVGQHPDKHGDGAANAAAIAGLYRNDPRVEVIVFTGLASEAALRAGASALLRGIRSVKDFEYERDMAEINRTIAGIDTVFLMSDPTLAAVSSSVVRELAAHGADISKFIPNPTNA